MTDSSQPDAGGTTLRGSLARLADALVGLARTRLELATIEYTEERERVGRQLVLMLAGIGCLLFALFFAAAAVIMLFWDSYRFIAIIGVITFFAVAGALLLWRRAEISNQAPIPFSATIAEMEKDRAAMSRTMNLPS